jgi:hypothetical protein
MGKVLTVPEELILMAAVVEGLVEETVLLERVH